MRLAWRLALSFMWLSLLSLDRLSAQDQALVSPRNEDGGSGVAVRKIVEDAVQWLVSHQREDGAWGGHESPRPIEVLCNVPGSHHAFRVATTALCVMALKDSGIADKRTLAAIDRGIDALLADWNVKRPSGLEHYSVWAFGYGLQCLAEILAKSPEDPRAKAIRDVCKSLVSKLAQYQSLDGGWGYLSLDEVPTFQPSWTSMSFTTSAILVGLDRARHVGIELDDSMISRALTSVQRCRMPSGSYSYGELWNSRPLAGINQIKGAACRTPACQYALSLFDPSSVSKEAHIRSLDDLLVTHTRFQIVSLRRPIPHESHYQISGYFYLFGHAYAAWVLESLGKEAMATYRKALFDAVMKCHQPDGSFWDYPLYSYHKPYGTAFAVIALARIDEEQKPAVLNSQR